MKSIDKNDVDISKLFSWGKKLEIKNSAGKVILRCYIRVVGDADLNRARVYGLRKSAELRKKLRNENSDERLALLPDIDTLDSDSIIDAILAEKTRDFTQDVVREIIESYPQEPEQDATLEEQEKYQTIVDEWEEKREKRIKEKLNSKIDEERKRLEKLSEGEMKKQFLSAYINRLAENEMYKHFEEMCVYLGSYKDAKYRIPLFKSINEFSNLPSLVKEKFINLYNTLSIDVEELKK